MISEFFSSASMHVAMDKNESISSLLSISMIVAISTRPIQVKQQLCGKI
jgi:hypothetical protein